MKVLELKTDYENGMAIKDILAKYQFKSCGSLYYYLKKNNIPKRGYTIHYNNPFIIDSPERDYWLGWIFSDGSVCSKERTNFIYLACLDNDILLKFKEFCGDRAKLNKFTYITPVTKKKKTMYKVVINSKELVDYFHHTYGILGKKSSTLCPNIEINWDLLRGVLDGDGSFKKGVVLTSCSKNWIDKIVSFYDKFNLHYTITKDSAYRLAIYRKEDIKRMYHYLYDNASIYLKRKQKDLYGLAKEESLEKLIG